jgi:hypothetical protein
MNNEFIPYDQALELKELGFDYDCFSIYRPNSILQYSHLTISNSEIDKQSKIPEATAIYEGCIALPLYQQAFRWFREKHDLFSFITTIEDTDYNGFKFTFWMAGRDLDRMAGRDLDRFPVCNTYEEAELSCLIKLIEIVKNK